ncbi:MAG: hypothetical protein PHY65_02800 [Bacteroidales bacterium]|nr:hypothetical protein [Bacteroidales bacterium]
MYIKNLPAYLKKLIQDILYVYDDGTLEDVVGNILIINNLTI